MKRTASLKRKGKKTNMKARKGKTLMCLNVKEYDCKE